MSNDIKEVCHLLEALFASCHVEELVDSCKEEVSGVAKYLQTGETTHLNEAYNHSGGSVGIDVDVFGLFDLGGSGSGSTTSSSTALATYRALAATDRKHSEAVARVLVLRKHGILPDTMKEVAVQLIDVLKQLTIACHPDLEFCLVSQNPPQVGEQFSVRLKYASTMSSDASFKIVKIVSVGCKIVGGQLAEGLVVRSPITVTGLFERTACNASIAIDIDPGVGPILALPKAAVPVLIAESGWDTASTKVIWSGSTVQITGTIKSTNTSYSHGIGVSKIASLPPSCPRPSRQVMCHCGGGRVDVRCDGSLELIHCYQAPDRLEISVEYPIDFAGAAAIDVKSHGFQRDLNTNDNPVAARVGNEVFLFGWIKPDPHGGVDLAAAKDLLFGTANVPGPKATSVSSVLAFNGGGKLDKGVVSVTSTGNVAELRYTGTGSKEPHFGFSLDGIKYTV